MSWLGIDPGLTGALVELHDQELIIHDMPVINKRPDPGGLIAIMSAFIHDVDDCRAVVELTHGQPGNGVKQAFSIGFMQGTLLTCLQVMEIPYDRVAPGVWKRKLKLIGKGKDASRQRAIELFPSYADQFARKKDEGRAEAALIAWYGANQ